MDAMDPKYEPANIEMRQSSTIAVAVSLTLIGAITVGLRIFTRKHIVGALWADDWAMLTALIFAIGYAIEIVLSIKLFNEGFATRDLTGAEKVGIIKLTSAVICTYKMVLTMIKVSILCFYLRIAVRPTFARLCKWTLALIIACQVAVVATTIGQCRPFRKMYDINNTIPGYCINTNVFFQAISVFHIVTDIWVFLLPIPLLRSIDRPFKEKIGLFVVFSVGSFSILAAVFRLTFLHAFTVSKDPFFEIIPLHIWSVVEINVGILCASLPTLRPLISRAQRSRTREVRGFSMQTKEKLNPGIAAINPTVTSASIAIGLGATVRDSYKPPVPPKSPHHSARSSRKLIDVDVESLSSTASTPRTTGPRKLALLRRDENGIFRPEAVYQ